MTGAWPLVGLAAAAAYLVVGRRLSGRQARVWWNGGLLLTALSYVGFALAEGASGGALAAEVGGALAFGAMAARGLRGSRGWTAAGWLLHGVWDLLIQTDLGVAPAGYVAACIAFDVVVGVVLVLDAARR